MPLPLFKLGALLAKQISKPLGKILKDKAKQSQTFKNYFIIPSANLYHNIDITLRMRVLGLGSPDKVPPLTEKAAIELGGDILSEFFVFGTATALLFIEYFRQSSNTVKKENALVQKVADLEKEQRELLFKLDKTNQRIIEMNEFLSDQKTKMEDLNAKYAKIDTRRNMKFATQGSQTTDGLIVGKVMYSKNSKTNPNADVKNSIFYQVAHTTVNRLKHMIEAPIFPNNEIELVQQQTQSPANQTTQQKQQTKTNSTSKIIPNTALANVTKSAANKTTNDKLGSKK